MSDNGRVLVRKGCLRYVYMLIGMQEQGCYTEEVVYELEIDGKMRWKDVYKRRLSYICLTVSYMRGL